MLKIARIVRVKRDSGVLWLDLAKIKGKYPKSCVKNKRKIARDCQIDVDDPDSVRALLEQDHPWDIKPPHTVPQRRKMKDYHHEWNKSQALAHS
jgi:hypothetical protein